ncbi:MAG: glycosyltransferase family 2 protein [Clostridia bacterium]|jgi:glycosyltransferase involved in cell wall biosynthesis|nr:glycosyltransferase family 2 protein [Clostridia bacterium]
MKISVLTPSYNDEISITKTLNSLKNQTYTDWESIIIDDGSTDETKRIIEDYKKKNNLEDKIKYIYQENQDQLNALLNGLQYVKGDYIFILHSDDLLPSDEFFEKCVSIMESNPQYDALVGDLLIIDENDVENNCWKANKYELDDATPAKLILTCGANIYGDFFFHRKETFVTKVKENYLYWNTPMWLDLNNNAQMLNIKNVEFPILKYRVHSGNYINNEIGKFNVLNGELRTLTKAMKFYDIENFAFQNFMYNFLRKPIIRKLKLYKNYNVKYKKKETENKYPIIKKAIENYYGQDYKENLFLDSILGFYENKVDREIVLYNLENIEIYKGKDIRIFTKKLFNKELNDLYINFMNEMKKGFSKIIVYNDEDVEKANDLVKFMCLYPYVEVEKRSN